MNETGKKIITRLALWGFVVAIYLLLYEGLEEGMWPMIAHFRHMDWKVPTLVDGIVGSVLSPFIAGCLIATALRRQFAESPWPVLLAPSIVVFVLGYTSDSLYRPWWTEGLVRLAGGLVQGTFGRVAHPFSLWPLTR